MQWERLKYLPVNNCAYWGKPAAWSQSQASFASNSAKRNRAYEVCNFWLFSLWGKYKRPIQHYYCLIIFFFYWTYKAILFHPKWNNTPSGIIHHPLISLISCGLKAEAIWLLIECLWLKHGGSKECRQQAHMIPASLLLLFLCHSFTLTFLDFILT